MADTSSIAGVLAKSKPTKVYNLAEQSRVAISYKEPEYTANSDALGTLRILKAMRPRDLCSTFRLPHKFPYKGTPIILQAFNS